MTVFWVGSTDESIGDSRLRNIIHRLLTGAPALALAFLALWASAYPSRAQTAFQNFSAMLEFSGLWWATAILLCYFGLWLWTSFDPVVARRSTIRQALRDFHSELQQLRSKIASISVDVDFEPLSKAHHEALQSMGEWINREMSRAALTKFADPSIAAATYVWPGEHDPEIQRQRNSSLLLLDGRIKVLELFMRDDSFDGPSRSLGTRIKDWRNKKSSE